MDPREWREINRVRYHFRKLKMMSKEGLMKGPEKTGLKEGSDGLEKQDWGRV